MISAIFDRLFGRNKPPPSALKVVVPAPPAAPKPTAVPALPADPAVQLPAGLGAQRPLVSPSGALAGFEFYAGAALIQRLRPVEDRVVVRASTTNVLGAMRLCIGQKLVALAGFPAAWLDCVDGENLFLPGMRLILNLDSLASEPARMAALLTRLRAAGVLLGWQLPATASEPCPEGAPDFAVLRLPPAADLAAWRTAAAAASSRWPGVPQVLMDLPDVDVLEAMLRPPVALAACVVGNTTTTARLQLLPPQAQRLLLLLNRLVRDDDSALLVADIKSDAALAVRLLQFLNSAGASPGRELDSIEQAVAVLGRNALYRWVSQMLVRLAPPRPAAGGLQAMALARARLLEMLARDAGEASPGSFYLLGLSSMLPLLLQCSVEDATGSLQLPAPALQALHSASGPWQPYLALAQALERHDMATTGALAASFGGLEAVLHHASQAWLTT